MRAALVLLALAAATVPTGAQAPADDAPVIDMLPMIDGMIGPDEAAPAPVAPPPLPEAPAAAPLPPRPAVTPLRLADNDAALKRLTDAGMLRLSGERIVADLVLDLPRVPPGAVLTLTYRNSINVLPAQSGLRVSLNGREAGTVPADAFDGFVTVELPATGLVPGRNTVRLAASHHHRIFCGVDASFGVWTELDLSQSGVRTGDAREAPDARALLASAAGAGTGPVAIHVAPDADAAVAQALADALGEILGGRRVTLGSPWDAAPYPQVPRITLRRGGAPDAVAAVGADGAPLVVVTHGAVSGDPLAALPPMRRGVVAGVWREPVAPRRLAPGQRTALADLGFSPAAQAAAYFDDAVRFVLPDDWLALASQKGHLFLNYRFAPGLPQGARMLINVNGATVRELPLDRDGGEALPTLDVGFRASLLGPGTNTLEFVTIVGAAEPRLPCPPLPDPIVTISPESLLVVPTTPAMFFDGMERGLPGVSAATLSFGGGVAPGVAEDVKAAFGSPPAGGAGAPAATLEVVAADSLDPAAAGDLGVSTAALAALLERRPAEDAAPPANDGGPFAAATGLLGRLWQGLQALAVPGDQPLAEWLRGRSGAAVLVQPAADQPDRLVLVLGSGADPAAVARSVAADRNTHDGPTGRVALLTSDGRWESWRPPFAPPRLANGITVGNLRAVLGNYASWSPLAFTGILFVLTIASGLVAVVFIRTTRGTGRR